MVCSLTLSTLICVFVPIFSMPFLLTHTDLSSMFLFLCLFGFEAMYSSVYVPKTTGEIFFQLSVFVSIFRGLLTLSIHLCDFLVVQTCFAFLCDCVSSQLCMLWFIVIWDTQWMLGKTSQSMSKPYVHSAPADLTIRAVQLTKYG